ncbi:hypothetical protein E2I00_005383 [Balaenoptera physalus]|uniref:SAP domain-containing ribonucleoprotein n=2 Tax=Laurasiatheria TaxID=314145 RepID=A0A643CBJ3_BALPH|nr:hypothetical protein E2I00_005383 [Balaenoptera physalus]
MATETVELHKLKNYLFFFSPPPGSFCKLRKSFILFSQLAELKQECLARGLETKGIKQDLINRLQAYLEEHAEEEANEEDVLGDETEEEEPKPIELPVKEEEPPEKTVDVAAEKKVVKITSEIPQTERMQKRAERFNVPVSLESKKAARAARFGISSVPSKGLSSDAKPMVNLDKLKERAQRFGLNVSSISRKFSMPPKRSSVWVSPLDEGLGLAHKKFISKRNGQRRGKEQSALGLPDEKLLMLSVLQWFPSLRLFLVTYIPKCTVMCLGPALQ